MKNEKNSHQEYQEFVLKVSKASKDLNDAFNSLSPENQQKFKLEMKTILSINFANLINLLKN